MMVPAISDLREARDLLSRMSNPAAQRVAAGLERALRGEDPGIALGIAAECGGPSPLKQDRIVRRNAALQQWRRECFGGRSTRAAATEIDRLCRHYLHGEPPRLKFMPPRPHREYLIEIVSVGERLLKSDALRAVLGVDECAASRHGMAG